MAPDTGLLITRLSRLASRRVWLLAAAVVAASSPARPVAQGTGSFTLDDVLSYPFPQQLIVSPAGSAIAWVFNERGVRNIYVAEGPDFKARRVTSYGSDDGQELSWLSFSDDGRYVLYVRGGDHDASNPASAKPPNPAASPAEVRVQVWATAIANGETKLVGDGDAPAVAPGNHRVAFIKNGRLSIAPLDGSTPAETIAINGVSAAPTWSPDGRILALESHRDGHSLIALIADVHQPVRYLGASTSRDSAPVWSADGREIAFLRQPGLITRKKTGPFEPEPWSIWVADAATGMAREVWKSGGALVGSLPHSNGGASVQWAGGNRLVFLSYQDGWPHLYSVSAGGGTALPLTPGPFMVEQWSLTPDRRSIVYSANAGPDRNDLERRHLFKVAIDVAKPVQVTSGRGIEWSPTVIADGKTVAYLASDARHPPRPMIIPLEGGMPRGIADASLPAQFPASVLVEPEAVSVRAESVELRGQVFKSAQGPPRRPALVFVHGGPAQQMLLGWHYAEYYAHAYAINQYLAERGFLVMAVNYRLGIGYGHAFEYPEESSRGETPEYDDVLNAAKYLQTRSDVDPLRVGIWGGSYGGYLTALGLSHDSDVFAAGVDVHGVHDRLIRDLDATTFPTLDDMSDTTPIWMSPVLLIHGDDDRTVSFQQTVDLESRLRDKGVMVDVLVIPDDVHDFLLFRSWRSIGAATAAFFERTLLNREH